MKKKTLFIVALLVLVFSVTLVFAKQHTPEDRGKIHFNNPTFAGGTKSCGSCHPDGKNLEKSGMKTTFRIMDVEQSSLEEAINVCIVNANRGQAIDVNSAEMQEMVSYIKSLGNR